MVGESLKLIEELLKKAGDKETETWIKDYRLVIDNLINNTAIWEKGGSQRFFSHIEPNFLLPCCPVRLRDARPAGWVTCSSTVHVNAESPKQDSKRFNF